MLTAVARHAGLVTGRVLGLALVVAEPFLGAFAAGFADAAFGAPDDLDYTPTPEPVPFPGRVGDPMPLEDLVRRAA